MTGIELKPDGSPIERMLFCQNKAFEGAHAHSSAWRTT